MLPWISEFVNIPLMNQVQFRALAAAFISFLVVVLAGPRTIAWLRRMKIGDSGESDAPALRTHSAGKANTPTMGGVMIAAAVVLSTILLVDLSEPYAQWGLMVLLWMGALGGADDWLKLTAARRAGGRQGLHAWEKLLFQLGIGMLIGVFAWRHGLTDVNRMAHVVNLPFQRTWAPTDAGWVPNEQLWRFSAWAFVGVATLMIAGMSNAANITDGMDGLAAGICGIIGSGVLALALIAGRDPLAKYFLVPHIPGADEYGVMVGAMIGACFGFLWWNCAPAQVFMGDTGSLLLGGLLGYGAVVLRQEIVVLMMSGVLLAGIVSVVLQVGYFKYTRLTTGEGRRIFRVAPIHHHFHLGGWTEQQVVVRFWIVSALLVVFALATIKVR